MQLQEVRQRLDKTLDGIANFAKFERVLAAVCLLTPALLWLFDSFTLRDSISAYFEMDQNQIFYVPLTVAAMLFVVNGVIKHEHSYNTVLGVMLIGVVLFNHHDFPVLHMLFAVAFFAGNAAVIYFFSRNTPPRFKTYVVVFIVIAVCAWKPLGWYSLFWAEWLSLAAIGIHYILASAASVRFYDVAPRSA